MNWREEVGQRFGAQHCALGLQVAVCATKAAAPIQLGGHRMAGCMSG